MAILRNIRILGALAFVLGWLLVPFLVSLFFREHGSITDVFLNAYKPNNFFMFQIGGIFGFPLLLLTAGKYMVGHSYIVIALAYICVPYLVWFFLKERQFQKYINYLMIALNFTIGAYIPFVGLLGLGPV